MRGKWTTRVPIGRDVHELMHSTSARWSRKERNESQVIAGAATSMLVPSMPALVRCQHGRGEWHGSLGDIAPTSTNLEALVLGRTPINLNRGKGQNPEAGVLLVGPSGNSIVSAFLNHHHRVRLPCFNTA